MLRSSKRSEHGFRSVGSESVNDIVGLTHTPQRTAGVECQFALGVETGCKCGASGARREFVNRSNAVLCGHENVVAVVDRYTDRIIQSRSESGLGAVGSDLVDEDRKSTR